uniref:BTB domain-containing protein n=1 Tax=Oryza meridionalis TaxID=40149 RepID=A0A0E0DJL7_9ORYZ
MEAPVFKLLFHFVYTDSLPEMTTCASNLLVAADIATNLERLKLICESMLCKYISASTVLNILALADQHHCHGLNSEECVLSFSWLTGEPEYSHRHRRLQASEQEPPHSYERIGCCAGTSTE